MMMNERRQQRTRGDDGGGQGCKGFGGGSGSADESLLLLSHKKMLLSYVKLGFSGYETQMSYPTSKHGLRLWTTANSRMQKKNTATLLAIFITMQIRR